jgi:hypothetical protein
VTRLQAEQSGVRIDVRARDVSVLQNVQADSGADPTSSSVGTGFLPTVVKLPGGEVNQSPPSNVEVKYNWSHSSAPPLSPWRRQVKLHILRFVATGRTL